MILSIIAAKTAKASVTGIASREAADTSKAGLVRPISWRAGAIVNFFTLKIIGSSKAAVVGKNG